MKPSVRVCVCGACVWVNVCAVNVCAVCACVCACVSKSAGAFSYPFLLFSKTLRSIHDSTG